MSTSDLRELLKRSLLRIEELEASLEEQTLAAREPIAIIGLGCRFPGGGGDPQAFWSSLLRGVDAIGEIPPARWPASFPRPTQPAARWGGLLEQIDQFDAEFFQISPREAVSMDPQQRLLLEVAWEAMEDAGQLPEQLVGSRTGVFVGIMNLDYKERFIVGDPQLLDLYCFLGNGLSEAPGRLSYVLGLQGPCMAVDTACSSSLVAVHLACQSLRRGESTLALAGGVHLILSPLMMEMMSRTQGLSPDGRCKTFDARANGMVRAEGCGVLILKRLADARRDGDPIRAVLRGSAVNQDGGSSGFTVPNVLSQEALLRQALDSAGVAASQISYVEAHGTGTPLGDPIEMEALKRVLGQPRADDSQCAVSSVKTNLGHLEAAAGVAGLIKTVLALQHGRIPRHLHLQTLNPRISLAGTPLVIPVQERAFNAPPGPRLAGVSSFGVSGINAHAIVEEAPAPPSAEAPAPLPRDHVLTLSGRTEAALRAMAERYVQFLQPTASAPAAPAAAISYTASARRSHHAHRLAVVGKTQGEWLAALQQFAKGETAPGLTVGRAEPGLPPRVVFIFSGHGSQWFGMAQQLLAEEPVFREALLGCEAAIQRECGLSVVQELTADQGRLWSARVDIIQPVLFSLQLALTALWRSWGVVPAAVVGTSMGEVAAAQVCGALSLDEAVRIICRRSQLIQKLAGRGAMAVVELTLAQAQQLSDGYAGRLSVAASNGPRSTVLSGEPEIIEAVLDRLQREGAFCRRLQGGSAASHSHQVDGLREELLQALGELPPRDPTLTMFSTVTAQPVPAAGLDAGYWFRNMREPVMLWPTVAALIAQKYTVFVEVSPHPVLLPALQDGVAQLGGGALTLATLRRGQPERRCMLDTLAELHVRGQAVHWRQLHRSDSPCVALPTYPWQRERYWLQEQPAPAARRAGGTAGVQGAATHPLLGAPFAVSTQPGACFWEQQVSLRATPWLKDHRIGGQAVFPGAGFLEMALAASSQAAAGSAGALSDVRFEQLLQLDEQAEYTLQTALMTQGPEAGHLQISQRRGSEWVRHAVARVQSASPAAPVRAPAEPLQAIKARCPTHRSKEAHYQRVTDSGGEYGPLFQAVEELWLGSRELLGRVRLPELSDDAAPRYRLHPIWLDACLQVALASAQLESGELWVPSGLDQLRVEAAASSPAWVHVQHPAEASGGAVGRTCALRAFDAEGQTLLEVQGLKLARLAPGAAPSPLSELFYEVKWREQPLAAPPAARSAAAPWLLLLDSQGLGRRLQAALRQRGQDCITVELGPQLVRLAPSEYRLNPTAPGEYLQLLRDSLGPSGACQGILHGFSLNATPPADLTVEALDQDQRCGSLSALQLVQALAQTGWRDLPPLWLLTHGAVAIEKGAAVLAPSQAPLWGLGKVLTVERPELACRMVDVDGDGGPAPQWEQGLVDELLAAGPEPAVALHQGRRYVARLLRSQLGASRAPAKPPVHGAGTYLVTGGLSGLGLATAEWLAEAGARHLVLLGRREPTDSARATLERLRSCGVTVTTAQVDVASAQVLAPVLAELGGSQPPLRGIVHAAGVLDDALLAEQSPERFARAMAPKVRGTFNLHQLTAQQPLDFFICYSSVMSLLGSPGQANYVAANAFLDAFAHYRQHQGKPMTSINWGLFTEVGLATVHTRVVGRLAERGMQSLTLEEAKGVFLQLLAAPRTQLGVMRLEPRKWVEYYPHLAGSPLWNELLHDAPVAKAASQEAPFRAALRKAPPAERLAVLKGLVAQELGHILRLDARRIDHQTPFRQLGVDSLMSLEMRNLLERNLGEKLPAVLLLTYPTIEALGVHLLEKLALAEPVKTADGPPEPRPDSPPAEDLSLLSEEELLARLQDELSLTKKGGKP